MDTWLAQFRRFWSAHIDALERHLNRMDQDQDRMNRTPRGSAPPKKNAPTKDAAKKKETSKKTTRPIPRTR
jgi:argininosuccinate lyase